jgi:amino acid transporter
VTVRGAAFLGIGAMVGAGIFALLGEAGTVAGSAVWLSFLIAGIVASLLGYTTVKLGVRYPSSGGLIAYLVQGFGNGRLVGIASWLGYFAAIVIVCSMVIANLVDLSAIASVGSACSLLIFLLVGASGYRLRKETGSLGAIVLLGMAATAIVLVFFGIDTLRNDPETFVAIVGVVALAVVLDLVWKRIRGPRQEPATVGDSPQ